MASTYLQQGFSRGRGFPELPSGLGHNLLLPPLPAPSLSSGTSHQAAPSGALESHFQSPAPTAGLELENSAEEKQQVGWEFGVGDASGRGLPESAAEERAVPRGLGIPASLTLPGSSALATALSFAAQAWSLNFTFSFLSEAWIEGRGWSKGRAETGRGLRGKRSEVLEGTVSQAQAEETAVLRLFWVLRSLWGLLVSFPST